MLLALFGVCHLPPPEDVSVELVYGEVSRGEEFRRLRVTENW